MAYSGASGNGTPPLPPMSFTNTSTGVPNGDPGGPQYIVIVLDTSPSMNQRVQGGLLLIDCAKSAIDHFIKVGLLHL